MNGSGLSRGAKLLALCLLGSPVQAQQLDLQFQVYKLDAKLEDPLQERLIVGGEPARQAMEKMPDFVRQGRAKLAAEVRIKTASGNRSRSASSKDKLEVDDDWEVVNGLELEIDPVINPSGSAIDLSLSGTFSEKSGRNVKIRRLTASILAGAGQPTLLSRWQEKEEILLLVMTPTLPDDGSPADKPARQIYVDAAFYESANDAKGKRAPVARVTFPTRSGQRARNEVHVPLLYDVDGGIESHNIGLVVEVDPVIDAAGQSVELNASVQFSEHTGKTEKVDDTRVPLVRIRSSRIQQTLNDGDETIEDVTLTTLADRNAKPDPWKSKIGCRIHGVR